MQEQNTYYEDLLIGHFTGGLSFEEEEKLSALLSDDMEFRKQYDVMAKLFAVTSVPAFESEKESNYEQLKKMIPELSKKEPERKSIRLWLNKYQKIAAVLLFIIALGTVYLGVRIFNGEGKLNIFETSVPKDSQIKIILPDSTIVWINSESKFYYYSNFGKKERKVFLEGEAYFEVRKNDKLPFFVHTKHIDTKVVGTVFNINAYEQNPTVEVVLVEGAVEVFPSGSSVKEKLLLRPDQILIYDKSTKSTSIEDTNTNKYTSWTTGKLSFVDATFEEVAKELERKYNKIIRIKNPQLKKEVFSGSIDPALSPTEVISFLDVDNKFSIVQKKDTIFVY